VFLFLFLSDSVNPLGVPKVHNRWNRVDSVLCKVYTVTALCVCVFIYVHACSLKYAQGKRWCSNRRPDNLLTAPVTKHTPSQEWVFCVVVVKVCF